MSCDDWIDALRDHAAGNEATPGLQSHLEACAECRQQLEDDRSKLALLDRALAAEVSIAPPVRRKNTRWLAAAAAVLILALAGWWTLRPGPQLMPADPSIASWRSPTAGLLETPTNDLLEGSPSFGGYDFLERR